MVLVDAEVLDTLWDLAYNVASNMEATKYLDTPEGGWKEQKLWDAQAAAYMALHPLERDQ
jgi:hypothetical protein